jgi:hypothetical protein
MTFRVGQKVVYIGPDFRGHPMVGHFRLSVPIPNEVYTIRQHAPRKEGDGYLLNEIRNAEHVCPTNGLCEISVYAGHLRPVVERKTDISIFKAMLNPRGVDA